MAVEFWAALAGAVVGGGASLAGSVLVNRREHVRVARIRLYDDLVPSLMDGLEPSGFVPVSDFDKVLAATRRAAVLAGRPAVRMADEIAQAYEAWWDAMDARGGAADEYGDPTETPDRDEALEEVRRRVKALSNWAEGKIL